MSTSGKREPWHSEISEVAPNVLITRGTDQKEMIRNFSYEEMVFLVLTGRMPSKVERNMLRAVIIAYNSHGITGQSTVAVRCAADCRSDFLHALIAGFSTGSGIYHLGALGVAMQELTTLAKMTDSQVLQNISARLPVRRRVIGFGHRYHQVDPRARTLMEIADETGFSGAHLHTARTIEAYLRENEGIAINIEGAAAAILLDLGFDPAVAELFIILGRSPMFAAAYLERLQQRPAPFQRIEVYDVIAGEEDDL